jgi:hypothetical protein
VRVFRFLPRQVRRARRVFELPTDAFRPRASVHHVGVGVVGVVYDALVVFFLFFFFQFFFFFFFSRKKWW